MAYNTVINKMNFKILVAMPNKDEYTTVHESDYVTPEMAQQMQPKERIVKTYITDIDLELPLQSDKE